MAAPRGLAALPAFRQRLPWIGADLQTVRNNLVRPRVDLSAWPWREALLPMLDRSGDRLVARYALPNPSRGPTVMLVHGLGGSAESTYVRAAARAFLAAGHPVLRLDLRGAGAARPHCALQYHAGRTQDLADALAALPDFVVGDGIAAMGFSLGANMLLKYLGEQGAEGPIRCAVAVSAPLDLAATLAAMLRPRNRLYHRYLLRRLQAEALAPGAALTARERRAIAGARTIFDFDQSFIAPRNGFADAWDYYERCSSGRFLPSIRVPTLVVHALDDPWIPRAAYDGFDWAANASLHPLISPRGGHVGFHGVGSDTPWHDQAAVAFVRAAAG